MNKLLKYILIGIGITSLSIASVKAENYTTTVIQEYTNKVNVGTFYSNTEYDAICINNISCNNKQLWISFNNGGAFNYESANGNSNMVCGFYDGIYYSTSSACTIQLVGIKFNQFTSQQCELEYNLIPISEVTANYCRLNFDLIDPADCPIQPSGSGQVSRSSLFVNDTQYPGNGIIRIGIPDYIGRSITYNDDENLIDIEGYNADTEYIENVINQEKLTPTNEDFENMLVGLANFFPYLAIALLFYFLIKVVYKIFK